MELQQLSYFLETCGADSITQAALRARVSQPALSRHVKLLEEELGVALFTRTARGVALTEAGAILRDRAERLLKDVGAMRQDVASSASEPRGELRIGTLTSLLAYLAAPAMAAFRTAYPQVSFRIIEETSRAMRDAVASGRIDVGFVSMVEDLEGLGIRPLLREQLFVVGHREHGLRIDHPAPPGVLSHMPLILTARPNSLRRMVDRLLGGLSGDGIVAFEVETLTLAMELVKLRQGLSVFPFSAIDAYVTRNEVSAAPLAEVHMSWALAYARERALSTSVRLFIDMVQSTTRERIRAGMWLTATLEILPLGDRAL
ncbi:MAG: LysR family transcriptional regulator [Proteobacteria bacterium]|nr:LysR family transcriptional regulator [Pseudomonadota bacterium]